MQSTKTVKEQCLKNKLIEIVEKQDKARCFESCGARNTTDSCWIGCFFDTVLGLEAAKSTSSPMAGMGIESIERSSQQLKEDAKPYNGSIRELLFKPVYASRAI